MKLFKNPGKLFGAILIGTILCSFITPFAFHKAMANDPELEKKIADKYGVKIQMSGTSFSITDAVGGSKEATQNWAMTARDQKIILNLKRGEISIRTFEGDAGQIRIAAKANTKSSQPFLTLTESNEAIIITDTGEARSVDVEVSLPMNFKGKLDLSNISGDISLYDVRAEALQVKSISADLDINNCHIGFISANNVNGEIEIDSVIEFSADVNNVRGDVKISTPSPKHTNFTLQSTRGDIENPFPSAQDPQYRISVTTVNGDIDIR